MRLSLLFLASGLAAMASAPEQAVSSMLARGSGSYLEMSRVFYGGATEEVFAAKVAYQAAQLVGTWLARYDDAGREVPFKSLPAKARAWKDGSEGSYDSRQDIIYFKEGAVVPVSHVVHELGHSTQRTSIFERSGVMQSAVRKLGTKNGWVAYNAVRYPEPIARQAGRAPRFSKHPFVEYLCQQHEYEIRLQAMNRYYFARVGRAIRTPDEARECLSMAAEEADPVRRAHYREVFELPKVRAIIEETDGKEAAEAFWDALAVLAPGHA